MKKILKMISPFNAQEDIPIACFILKKLLALVLIFFVSIILAEGLTIIVHYIMGYNVLQGEMLSAQAMTLMKYYGYAVFMLVTILYCKLIEKRPVKSMGFNGKLLGYLKGILIGIVLLAVSVGIINLLLVSTIFDLLIINDKNIWTAIIISSCVFGLSHIFNGKILQVITTAVLGIIFCDGIHNALITLFVAILA